MWANGEDSRAFTVGARIFWEEFFFFFFENLLIIEPLSPVLVVGQLEFREEALSTDITEIEKLELVQDRKGWVEKLRQEINEFM